MFRRTVLPARWGNLVVAVVCFMLVGIAVGLEVLLGMEPCPLCIFQRLVFVLFGGVLLVGVWMPGRTIAALASVTALGGVALALRHLWLQSLPPDQVPACGPGLDYLLGAFPLADVVSMVLAGSGECAEVDQVLGVSLPLWTLAGYLILGLVAVTINWQAAGSRRA